MKRLAFATGLLAVALLVPSSAPGALVNIDVLDDEYDPQEATFYFPANPSARWDWGGIGGSTTNQHTVTQNKGLFKSGAPKDTGSFEVNTSSGTYPYHCEVHGDAMTGTLNILTGFSERDADSVRVSWATDKSTTGKRFDVRYAVDGGDFLIWQRGTRKRSKVFGNDDKPEAFDPVAHDYEFSARSIKGKPSKKKRSKYSPPADPEAF
jgi:hypothetical protein